MTGEIELGKDVEVTFNSVTNIGSGSKFLFGHVRILTNSRLHFLVTKEPLQDKFYIDECTARSNQSGESKLLVQNSCVVNETDMVLDRVKPMLSDDGRKLQFKQFAFNEG